VTATPRPEFPRFTTPSAAAIVAAAAVVAGCVLLFAVSEALPVFIIGLILAYILDPVVTWLAGHRVPRGIGTLIAMVLLAVVVGVIAVLFVGTVTEQAAKFVANLPQAFQQLEDWVVSLNLSEQVTSDLVGFFNGIEQSIKSFDFASLIEPIVGAVVGILGSFFTLLTLPFFLFFLLAGRPALGRQVHDVLPRVWRDDVLTVLGITLNSFGTYIRAEAIVASILGVMTFIGIMLLSVTVDPQFAEFAVLLAVIAAFSELIPNYGPWIASIPAVLISLTISPEAVVATIVLYLILMFTEGQVLVPKIEGGAFSFHPALVLFLVVAGVALMGILGAILALPVTAAAWRSVRFAFRRAGGLSREAALAWPDDPDLDTIVQPLPAVDTPPPVRTADEAALAVEPGTTG
jgi:predicted PurR-regulated permease PerM